MRTLPLKGSLALMALLAGLAASGALADEPVRVPASEAATRLQIIAAPITAPSLQSWYQSTTAVPMTFLHQGKQYIVFATGQGDRTSLIALTLPRK